MSKRKYADAGRAAVLALALASLVRIAAADAGAYAAMDAIAKYQMGQAEEIALARSAAPASISDAADVMILGDDGFKTVAKGTNGFVCMVQRSWFAPFDDPEFWNAKTRSPICFNTPAAATVLPAFLERTRWALAGISKSEMIERTRASVASGTQGAAPGSMGYMMSRDARLSDADGHWHPHLMFYVSATSTSSWGANLKGSPIFGADPGPDQVTVFFIPVGRWSDGQADAK